MVPLHYAAPLSGEDGGVLAYYSGLIGRTLVPLRLRELRRWLRAPPADCLFPEDAFPGAAPRAWCLLFEAVPPGPRAARRGAGAPAALLAALAAQPWVAAHLAEILAVPRPGPLAALAGTPGGGRLAARLRRNAALQQGLAAGPHRAAPQCGRALGSCGERDAARLLREPERFAPEAAAANPRRGVFLAALAAAAARGPLEPRPWFAGAAALARAREGRAFEALFRFRRVARAAGLPPAAAGGLLFECDPGLAAELAPRLGRAAGGSGLSLFLALGFRTPRGAAAGVRALVPRAWAAASSGGTLLRNEGAPLDPALPVDFAAPGFAFLAAEARKAGAAVRGAAAVELAARALVALLAHGAPGGAAGLALALALAPFPGRAAVVAAAARRAGAAVSPSPAHAYVFGLGVCRVLRAAPADQCLPALEAALLLSEDPAPGASGPSVRAALGSAVAALRRARAAAAGWRRKAARLAGRRRFAPTLAALEALPPGPGRPCGGAAYLRAFESFWGARPTLRRATSAPGGLAELLAAGAVAVACPAGPLAEGPAPPEWGLAPGAWLRWAPGCAGACAGACACAGTVVDAVAPGLFGDPPAERLAALRPPPGWAVAPAWRLGGLSADGAQKKGLPPGAAAFLVCPDAPAACVLGAPRRFPAEARAAAGELAAALAGPARA